MLFSFPPNVSAEPLIVVRQYEHVGSIIDSDGSTMCDAKYRGSLASGAYAPLSDRIFASEQVPQELKLQLF